MNVYDRMNFLVFGLDFFNIRPEIQFQLVH